MVHKTAALLKYMPDWYHLSKGSAGYFRKQALFYMTRYHKGISWSTHKNAMNRFQYYLKSEMWLAPRISQLKVDGNRMRIAAACDEHEIPYHHFISTLPKLNVNIQLGTLARLTIYEPKTFKSLVDLCKETKKEPLQPARFDNKKL